MSRTRLGALDWCRLPAALLVVAIHTGPLLSLDAGANYLITDILARLAVPFFFSVSGYFLVPKLERDGVRALLPYLKKLSLLYGFSLLLYLPLLVYSGYFAQPGLSLALLKDILFNGPFYHLWYFPAAILGGCVVYLLVKRLGRRGALIAAALLYLIGLMGDSYYALAAVLPPLKAFYDLLFLCFDYTRNGLFFAPLFLLVGGLCSGQNPRRPNLGFFCSLAALLAEGLLVRHFQLARFDALYLSLPFCLYFLLGSLKALDVPERPGLRTTATVVYLVHPLCIVAVRAAAKVLGLSVLLVDHSFVHYLAVVCASLTTAFLFERLKRPRIPKTGRAWLELDCAALRHNISALSELLPEDCALMAVLKADAYGHGALDVARQCAKAGIRAFAVATADEGARLRRGGIRGEILVLGRTPSEAAPVLARYRLSQTVFSAPYAAELDRMGRRVNVHLKLDTGMHRLGIPWSGAEAFREIAKLKHLNIKGTFTHLAYTEGRSAEEQVRTQEQVRRFERGVELARAAGLSTGALHVESSYGLLNYGPMSCAYVRAGIALYGLLSAPGEPTRLTPNLRPALSLRARIAQIHTLEAGEPAGYDGAFTPQRPCRLATLTIGYADGYPRALSNGIGRVLVRGRPAPVAGLICMDQMLADVTEIPDAAPGDIVTLFGRDGDEELSPPQVALAAGTITNELLSRLGGRLERLVLNQ